MDSFNFTRAAMQMYDLRTMRHSPHRSTRRLPVTLKQIEKSRRALNQAGTIEDKEYLRSVLKHRLVDDGERLRESKNTIRAEFRRTLERWRTERVPEAVPVRAIPNETQESRLYRVTAIFALICEMGLAAWIFQH